MFKSVTPTGVVIIGNLFDFGGFMESLDEIRDQLRDALVALKAVLVAAVPADEVFFVRDLQGAAHVDGFCLARGAEFLPGVEWERVPDNKLSTLKRTCYCVQRSPGWFREDVRRIKRVLKSRRVGTGAGQYTNYVDLCSTFPAAFEALDRVYRLYFRWLAADTDLLELRAKFWSVSVSQLPSVGVCTLQYKYPTGLEVFPNGALAVVPWKVLPEIAANKIWRSPDSYALLGVEGWPAERVEGVSALLREASSEAEALAAFKLAEQLVP